MRRRSVLLWLGLLGLFAAATSSSFGPVYAPTLSGRVVDAATGEPVVGASVFAGYRAALFTLGEPASRSLDRRSAETDADGRFRIPGHLALSLLPLAVTDWKPSVRVFHPDYGMNIPGRPEAWQMHIELRPNEVGLDDLSDDRRLHTLCLGIDYEACGRLCRRVAGSEKPCQRG